MMHSVIVGSYNRPRMVAQAIRSVLDQTAQEFQLLVADDGSNDDTLSAIRGLLGDDPRCSLLTVEHEDDSRERPDCFRRAVLRINDAIRRVEGDIVHYLADDDWYAPTRFETFNDLFANPEVVVGYGRLWYVNADGSDYGYERFPIDVTNPCGLLDQMQIAHRRSVFDKIPKWDEYAHPSDGVFMGGMRSLWPFHGVDRIVAYKRMHALNMGETGNRSTGKRE